MRLHPGYRHAAQSVEVQSGEDTRGGLRLPLRLGYHQRARKHERPCAIPPGCLLLSAWATRK